MNRGLAKRTVFEERRAVRYFKSRLAYAVRRLEIEVHAFAILTTHFHLLIRSPEGRMSEGMRRVQNEYVRWFNRRHRRDGPLFRGRFVSRCAKSLRYRRLLVGYIDDNAVSAGVAHAPEAYEHGSARHYAGQDGPLWLNRSWIERDCAGLVGQGTFTWEMYRRAHSRRSVAELELADQRLHHPSREMDPLDDLVHSTPRSVLAWMRRKAALADGSVPGLPCVAARAVHATCLVASKSASWTIRSGRNNEIDLWNVLEVGLLRDLSGLRWREIGLRIAASPMAAKRRYQIHRREIVESGAYAEQVQAKASQLLNRLG